MKHSEESSTWGTQDFLDTVRSKLGQEKVNETRPAVQGLVTKNLIVNHHFQKAKSSLKGYPDKENPTDFELIDLVFANGAKRKGLYLAKIEYEANVIAAAQVLHSMLDNWAHLFYTTFQLPKDEDYRPKLEGANKLIQSTSLKEAIRYLFGLREYAYLKEFVNQNKHISLVPSQFKVEFPTDQELRHGIKFKAFGSHPSKWGDEILIELKKVVPLMSRSG